MRHSISLAAMSEEMENEFMSRNYSLPKGEKNRIEAFTKKAKQEVLPPVGGEVSVPSTMTVQELAQVLGRKPFEIIAALMELQIFATIREQLDFVVISKVARKFGYLVKRVDEQK